MGDPPESLVESFRWSRKCVEWLGKHSPSPWFMQMHNVPTSSWFSGYGCCEMGFHMINAAKQKAGAPPAFCPSYQIELSSKARLCAQVTLPKHCCQHIDILRLLSPSDRKLVKDKESGPKPSEDVWDFLLNTTFVNQEMCSRHQMMWGVQIEEIKTYFYMLYIDIAMQVRLD